MFRGIGLIIILVAVLQWAAFLLTPERRSVVLSADISNYSEPPSELREAFAQGWTLSATDGHRVYALERSRIH